GADQSNRSGWSAFARCLRGGQSIRLCTDETNCPPDGTSNGRYPASIGRRTQSRGRKKYESDTPGSSDVAVSCDLPVFLHAQSQLRLLSGLFWCYHCRTRETRRRYVSLSAADGGSNGVVDFGAPMLGAKIFQLAHVPNERWSFRKPFHGHYHWTA